MDKNLKKKQKNTNTDAGNESQGNEEEDVMAGGSADVQCTDDSVADWQAESNSEKDKEYTTDTQDMKTNTTHNRVKLRNVAKECVR